MGALIIWAVCFLYATFLLGSFPLPPAPGRPFSEKSIGASRFEFYDGISQRLSQWGAESSIWIALGGLVLLFAGWIFYRHAKSGGRRAGIPIVSFLIVFVSALLLADYSRDVEITSLQDYGSARSYWLLHSKKSTYPKWPTQELQRALESRVPSEIDSAIDSVVRPEFEKIPAYQGVFDACLPLYRELALNSGSLPEQPQSKEKTPYVFACRLMEGVIDRTGKVPVNNPAQCLYGPAVKILHALDRLGLRCPLSAVRGQPEKESTCREFKRNFGTDLFSFCT